jgi:hypothetical protein
MRNVPVKRIGPIGNQTILIPLPREMWLDAGEGCICGKCDGHAYWDTLAVSQNKRGDDRTWTVHAPEAHHVGLAR